MKKIAWKIVLLIILASLVFVWLIRAPILGSYFTKKTGLQISLEWIGLWPTHMNIYNFKVKNASGFQGHAFQAEKINCQYQFRKLFSDPTILDQIEIQNSILRIDIVSPTSSANNWTAIAKKIPEMQRGGHVIIKKLILTNFNVDIHGTSVFVKPKQTHFDQLEFDDIDSEKGFPTAALIQMIFQSTGVQELIKDLFSPGGSLSPLRLFGNQLQTLTEPSVDPTTTLPASPKQNPVSITPGV